MNKFIDRKNELKHLNDEYIKDGSSFVVLYGRRRTGKTTLIKEFIKNKKAIYFLATEESDVINREKFADAVTSIYEDDFKINFSDWESIFKYIVKKEKKPIVIIDEFQNLCIVNSAFPSMMQKIYDNVLKDTGAMLILCGSLISMMQRETLNYSSPLYGRRTSQIKLTQIPFTYYRDFYNTKDEKTLIELYSITGGVPKYVELFDCKTNIYDSINNHILNKNSFLYDEPEFLLRNEIKDIGNYFSIIKIIAEGNKKLNDISSKLQVPQSKLTFYIKTLRDLDILEREIPITDENPEKSKKGLYRIKDNYIKFWFKFIYPYKNQIEIGNTNFVMNKIKNNFIDSHVSYVYEEICKEKLLMNDTLNIEKVGKYWDKNIEIDIVGINKQKKLVYFGECKYRNEKMSFDILNKLIEKSKSIKYFYEYEKRYCLFSINGFEKKLIDYSKKNNILLFK